DHRRRRRRRDDRFRRLDLRRGLLRLAQAETTHYAALDPWLVWTAGASRRAGWVARRSTRLCTSLTIFDLGRWVAIGPPRLADAAAASQSELMPASALRCSAFSASAILGAGPNMRLASRFRTIRGLRSEATPVSISSESERAAMSAGTVSSETTRTSSLPDSTSSVQDRRCRGTSSTTQS